MKNLFLLISALFITSALLSQEKSSGWKELDNFHVLVAPVFHSAEKGNYHTVKDSAGLVLERAKKWQSTSFPSTLDANIFKPLIDRLVIETTAINEAVKAKKTDAELKLLMRKAHNTFHEILGKYNKTPH